MGTENEIVRNIWRSLGLVSEKICSLKAYDSAFVSPDIYVTVQSFP